MVGIVIQARMGSKRLPGKVLMNFCGKPMLLFQIELLKKFYLNVEIVVATSSNPLDDEIETFCNRNKINCYRGSEENVFDRFCCISEKFGFEHIIRLTGDNPLPNYKIINSCIKLHSDSVPDLTSTRRILPNKSIKRYVPKGSSVDIINGKTLLGIDQNTLSDFDKEHVIPVFFIDGFKVSILDNVTIYKQPLSVDTLEDLQKVSKYAESLVESNQLLNTLGYKE